MTLLFGLPIAIVLSMYLGRQFQRKYWGLDLPYEQRPSLCIGMGRNGVPIIKDGVWPL